MPNELVSCILATRNRSRFFAQALRCYAAQTYRRRELVVIDDGDEPVGGLCEGMPRLKYLRLSRRLTLGEKLNLGIRIAEGSILQKLDDDDYYASRFLATSVKRLTASRRRGAIVGWGSFLVHLAGAPELYRAGDGWMAGGTLAFRRQTWEAAPFRPVNEGEDRWFLEDHPGPHLRVVDAPEFYILVRHGRNTWKRFRTGASADGYFGSLPVYPRRIAEATDPVAARFYSALPAAAV